jgi:hypothetical protein
VGYHELLLALTLVGVLGAILVTALGLIASYLITKVLARTALGLAHINKDNNKQKRS